MPYPRFRKVLLPLLAFVAAFGYWLVDQVEVPLREARVAREGGSELSRSSDSAVAHVAGIETQESLVERMKQEASLPEGSWSERYGNAVAIEQRTRRSGGDRFVRESLLKTESERIPYVVWEERFRMEESGEWRLMSDAAYMGDRFLAQANRDDVDPDKLDTFLDRYDLYIEGRGHYSDFLTIGTRAPQLGKMTELVAAFAEAFPELIVEREGIAFTSRIPNDYEPTKEWALDNVNAPDAWEFETGSAEVVVAVIDTGIESLHTDLAPNLISNGNNDVWDFVNNDSNPEDSDGHGTHVAGIVAAAGNNGFGTSGVAWNLRILPLKVGDEDGLRTSAIVDALVYVREQRQAGMNIVATNNSYGSGSFSSATRNAIASHMFLSNQNVPGILFVAAAGNEGIDIDADSESLQYPAGYVTANIISVANSNQEDQLSGGSNYGEVSVDISAPGSEVRSTYLDNDYAYLTGTSMASPMVAGAVGLLASAEPALTWEQRKERILDTAHPVLSHRGRTVTGGRLDLLAMLRPDLKGHSMGIEFPVTNLVFIDQTGIDVPVRYEALAGAEVTASLVEGSGVVEVSGAEEGFTVRSVGEGIARVKFTATLSGIERSVERTFVVGRPADVSSGLVHQYTFDGEGNGEEDQKGNADGDYTNIERLDTEFGRGVRFKGGNSKLEVTPTYSTKVSYVALVKSEYLVVTGHPRIVNSPAYYLYLSSGEGQGVPDGNRHTFKFYANRREGVAPAEGIWNTPPRSIQDNEWMYLVGTYDSASSDNVPSMYINGTKQVLRTQQEAGGDAYAPTGPSFIGNNEAGDRQFEGLMKEVRMYNRELSQREVAAIGANLMFQKWGDFQFEGPSEIRPNRFLNLDYPAKNLGLFGTVDVRVDGDFSEYSLTLEDNSVQLKFEELGTGRVVLTLNDDIATYYFSHDFEVKEGVLMAGYYGGESEDGARAFLKVNDDLASGLFSVFNPNTGYKRFSVPVTIDPTTGAFSGEDGVSGMLDGVLAARVESENLDLFGSPIQSGKSELFVGEWRGAVLGDPGSTIRIWVTPDAEVFMERDGEKPDLGFGYSETVNDDGVYSFVSARGEDVWMLLNQDELELKGEFYSDPVMEFYATNEEGNPQGELSGVGFGGVVSSEETGVFGRFAASADDFAAFEELDSLSGLVAARETGESFSMVTSGRGYVGQLGRYDLPDAVARLVETRSPDLSLEGVVAGAAVLPVRSEGSSFYVFTLTGQDPKEVMVRARDLDSEKGQDLKLTLYRLLDGKAVRMTSNDDAGHFSRGGFQADVWAKLVAGWESLGVAPLAEGTDDPAMRVWLNEGTYLVELSGSEAGAGRGLLEVFELNEPFFE